MVKTKNLNTEVYFNSLLSNSLLALLLWFSSMLLISFPITTYPFATIFGVCLILMAQFILGPITSYITSFKISNDMEYFLYCETNNNYRTQLIKNLYKTPIKKLLETFIHFIVSSGIYSIFLYKIYNIDITLITYFFISCLLYSYIAMVLSYHNTYQLCMKKASNIAQKGINIDDIKNSNRFGNSMISNFIFYLVIPTIICSVLFYITNTMSHTEFKVYSTGLIAATDFTHSYPGHRMLSYKQQLLKIIIISSFNILILSYLTYLYFQNLNKSVGEMKKLLIKLKDKDYNSYISSDMDFSTQLSYTIYLIQKIISLFITLGNTTKKIEDQIVNTTHDLAAVYEQTNTTCNEQILIIRNLIETMQHTDDLAKDMLIRIDEVNKVADKTTQDVNYGFLSVESNLAKMEEITASNKIIIDEIKILASKIESVRDIVNLIDNVANLTKIIAFNAEMEAEKLDNSNDKFKNVSTNIRNLADKVMDLTSDIKKTISTIIDASTNLMITGEECTQKIEEGNRMTNNLQENLLGIKKSALSVSSSTSDINTIIEEQVKLFNHLKNCMESTNKEMNNFDSISSSVSKTISSLQDEISHLKSINEHTQEKI